MTDNQLIKQQKLVLARLALKTSTKYGEKSRQAGATMII